MKRWAQICLGLSFSALAAAACAVGDAGDDDSGIGVGGDGGNGTEDSGLRDSGGKQPPKEAGTPTDAGNFEEDGGSTDGGTSGGCASPVTCPNATPIGSISGDTDNDTKSASGYTSDFLLLRMTENDNGIGGVSMTATITLTSPPGENFDLYVYIANDSSTSTIECSSVNQSSTNASGADTVNLLFGETGVFSNGSDDSRNVTIEVRAKSTTCSSSAKWTLAIEGDT